MNSFAILCLDNNPISMEQLHLELRSFTSKFDVHTLDCLEDAKEALLHCEEQGQQVALVIASHHDNFNGQNFSPNLIKTQSQNLRAAYWSVVVRIFKQS